MRYLLALLFALALPAAAYAHDGVHVKGAYARETAASAKTGAVFLEIISPDATHDDVLTDVSTPVADKAQVHSMTVDDKGVMQMRPVDRLPVPAQKEIDFTPEGYHVMLTGLKQQLKPGDTFMMTMTFEREGKVAVPVTVKAMGDNTPAPDNTSMPGSMNGAHDMPGMESGAGDKGRDAGH